MNLKKVLILGIAGLVLWSAWGSEVHAGENIKSGFTEENGEYLIESSEQLELLSEMIVNREEIEPGVDAATASYRLCGDVEMRDEFRIGSRRTPFHGNFNGDGYRITGDFYIETGIPYGETGEIDYNHVAEQTIQITLEEWRSVPLLFESVKRNNIM